MNELIIFWIIYVIQFIIITEIIFISVVCFVHNKENYNIEKNDLAGFKFVSALIGFLITIISSVELVGESHRTIETQLIISSLTIVGLILLIIFFNINISLGKKMIGDK